MDEVKKWDGDRRRLGGGVRGGEGRREVAEWR